MFSGFKKSMSKAGSNIAKTFGVKAKTTTQTAGEGASSKVEETGKSISTKFSAAEPYVEKGVAAADAGIKQGVTAADGAITAGVATAEAKLQSALGGLEDSALSALGGAEAAAVKTEGKEGLSAFNGKTIQLKSVNSGRVVTLDGTTVKADGADGAANGAWKVNFLEDDYAFNFEQNGQFLSLKDGGITVGAAGDDTSFRIGEADGNITLESTSSLGTYLAFDASGNPAPSSSAGKDAQFLALPL